MTFAEKLAELQNPKSVVVTLVPRPLSIALDSVAQDTWHGLLREIFSVGKPYMHEERAKRILSGSTCERERHLNWAAWRHLHRPHRISVVPVFGSTAELPSSHSTHCWKCAPLLVEE